MNKQLLNNTISACKVGTYYSSHEIEDCVRAEYYGEGNRFIPLSVRSVRDVVKLPCVGWHFSYMGGIDRITKNIQSFAHQEYNNSNFLDNDRIEAMITSGSDMYGFGFMFRSIPVKNAFARHCKKNQAKYSAWICNYNPMPRKQLFKLYIKYICETTGMQGLYKTLKRIVKIVEWK